MPLVLELLRHGEAAASSPDGDAGRPLTPRGAEAIDRLARHLARRPAWDRVLVSPLRRARETAAIMIRPYAEGSPNGPVPVAEVTEALLPDAEPADLVRELRVLGADSGRVLLVSHMPLLGELWGYLCGPFALGGLKPGQILGISLSRGLGPGRGMRLSGFDADSIGP